MSSNISSSHINYYSNMYPENRVFAIIKVRNKKKWTKEEDLKLIKLAEKNKEKHWKEIAKNFVNKNPLQCFSRYKRIKPGIIKGTWSKEEDEKILSLVNVYGKSWSKLAKIMRSRNGKQIRDRYINVLDPDVKKGKFSYREDKKIKELYLKYGPRWATISRGLPHRTPDMIKNRFHSSIKKYLYKKNFLSKNENKDQKNISNPGENSKLGNTLIRSDVRHNVNANMDSKNENVQYNENHNKYYGIYYSKKNHYSNTQNECSNNDFKFTENENTSERFNIHYENIDLINLKSAQNVNLSISDTNYKNKIKFQLAKEINDNDNGIIFKKFYSQVQQQDNPDDSNRTVSNSDDNSERNKPPLKIENIDLIENFENPYYEFPDEQIQQSNPVNNNANILISSVFENHKNSSEYRTYISERNFGNKVQEVMLNDDIHLSNNNEKNHKLLNSKNSIAHNKEKMILMKNLNPKFYHSNVFYNNISNKKLKMLEKNKSNNLNENFQSNNQIKKENFESEKNGNKLNYYDITNKNSQELKFPHIDKNSELRFNNLTLNNKNIVSFSNNISSLKNKSNPVFYNDLNNNQTVNNQYHQEISSDQNKCRKLSNQSFHDNSKSTNLMSYTNLLSSSSNALSNEENENTLQDMNINKNNNYYFINPFEENYQINNLNFSDSPFRMKSPKYFDYEDFFINN